MQRKKIAGSEFGRYQFQVGDLVRRHQAGEPQQMFMYDVQNLGVVVEVTSGNRAEVAIHWQLGKRLSYYSVYAAEKIFELIAKADHAQ